MHAEALPAMQTYTRHTTISMLNLHHNCCQHILCGMKNAHGTTNLLPLYGDQPLTTPLASQVCISVPHMVCLAHFSLSQIDNKSAPCSKLPYMYTSSRGSV